MIPKFYYCDVYRISYWFCIGWKPLEFDKFFKKKFGFDMDSAGKGGFTAYCNDGKKEVIVIWVHPKELKSGALAHECVHAANMTLKERGVKPDFENDEPLAYLVGTLFEKAKK